MLRDGSCAAQRTFEGRWIFWKRVWGDWLGDGGGGVVAGVGDGGGDNAVGVGGIVDDRSGGGVEDNVSEFQGGEQGGRVSDTARDVGVRGGGYRVEVEEHAVCGEGVVWEGEGGDADGAVYDEKLGIFYHEPHERETKHTKKISGN